MRDEYFYEYDGTIFAHSDADYVEKSEKINCIIYLLDGHEDKMLELLKGLIDEQTFNMTLKSYDLERVSKCNYAMKKEELKISFLSQYYFQPNPDAEHIIVMNYSGMDQNLINYLYEEVSKVVGQDHVYITRAGCVISSHCGPGTIGVLYIKK